MTRVKQKTEMMRILDERTYFIRTKGIGNIIKAMKPSSVDAQRGPNASNICVANSYDTINFSRLEVFA